MLKTGHEHLHHMPAMHSLIPRTVETPRLCSWLLLLTTKSPHTGLK